MESRGRKILGSQGQIDCPAQPDLVDFCRAPRLLDLAGLEHRRDQAAAGRLSLHDRPAVPARCGAGAYRLAYALFVDTFADGGRWVGLTNLRRRGGLASV